MVEQRRPELIDEVVVRHGELDPVETTVATPARRIAEGGDQLDDLLRFQLMRDLAMDAFRNLRGRQEDATRLRIRLRAPAEVRELREHETVVAVHGIRERTIGRDDGVVVVGDLLPRRGRRRWMHAGGAAEDRERTAAARLGLVIAPQPFGRPPVLGHGLGVTGRVDPVLEREAADLDRREQRLKLVGHVRPPRYATECSVECPRPSPALSHVPPCWASPWRWPPAPALRHGRPSRIVRSTIAAPDRQWAQRAVEIAMQHKGAPYRWGGEEPSGFDCSGFVRYVYAQVGISLPHNAAKQYQFGTAGHPQRPPARRPRLLRPPSP